MVKAAVDQVNTDSKDVIYKPFLNGHGQTDDKLPRSPLYASSDPRVLNLNHRQLIVRGNLHPALVPMHPPVTWCGVQGR